jgi:hypothetical protein
MDDGMCYDCEWFFNKVEIEFQFLCPHCQKPFSENKRREDCGCFIEEQEFIVNDLYNYNARPQRAYHRLDHFKEVLGQFQGREGKHIPLEILDNIKNELSVCNEVTATDVKKVMRKLKLTKYMENFYFILSTITGAPPPYIKREIEDKIVRMFKMIDRLWSSIEKDKRMSFLSYYYIIYKLLELMGQTELMMQVPPLKTRLRIKQHDSLWQKVCDSLGWTWKPTETNSMVRPRAQKRKRKVVLHI